MEVTTGYGNVLSARGTHVGVSGAIVLVISLATARSLYGQTRRGKRAAERREEREASVAASITFLVVREYRRRVAALVEAGARQATQRQEEAPTQAVRVGELVWLVGVRSFAVAV